VAMLVLHPEKKREAAAKDARREKEAGAA
jgi:hypothetical protein